MDWMENAGKGMSEVDWMQLKQLVVSSRKDGPLRLMFVEGMAIWEPTPDLAHQSAVHRIVRSARPVTANGATMEVYTDVLFQTDVRSVVRCDIALYGTQLAHIHEIQTTVPLAVVEVVRPGHERGVCELIAPHCHRAGVADVVVMHPERRWVQMWSGGRRAEFSMPLTLELSGGFQISLDA